MKRILLNHYDVLRVTVDRPTTLTLDSKPRVSIWSRKRRDSIVALRKQVDRQAEQIRKLELELSDYEEDRF